MQIEGVAGLGSTSDELAFVPVPELPPEQPTSLPLQLLLEPSIPIEGRVQKRSFPLDEQDLALAVSLGARPDINLMGAGRIVAGRVVGRLVNPQDILQENLRERPLLTGVAVAGAVGAYVGWENLNDGRLSGSYTFGVADARVNLFAWYDLGTGDWAGRVRLDLSRVLQKF